MAARPGRIVKHLDVPLERPRPRSVVASPAFTALKQTCLGLLADELGAALDVVA